MEKKSKSKKPVVREAVIWVSGAGIREGVKGKKGYKRYIARLPKKMEKESVLVHNWVRPEVTREEWADGDMIGFNGFRVWWAAYDRKEHIKCSCGWAKNAKHIKTHYRFVSDKRKKNSNLLPN